MPYKPLTPASLKRQRILNAFFHADRWDEYTKPEFRKVFNAFKSEVKHQLGKHFTWEYDLYDPNVGWGDEFEAEFTLEGCFDDGIHTPVKLTLQGSHPIVAPLHMVIQHEDCDGYEVTGFYDFGRPLDHFLEALDDVRGEPVR